MVQVGQVYKQNSMNTASPGELTLMLFNGCLKFLLNAKKAIEDKNYDEKNINIQKAQKIIQELSITLDRKYKVAEQMSVMYEYMNRRLIEGNMKNDLEIIKEVEGYVTEFRDTWKEVIQINRQKQFKGNFA